MRRRAMYRWKSFWLGVVLLGAMAWGWGWVHSMRKVERVGIEGPYVQWSSLALVGGSFSASTQFAGNGTSYQWERYTWPIGNDPGRPLWAFREWDKSAAMMRWIAFPMWVPMAVVAALWSGWLVWRGGKERRASLTEMKVEAEESR